MAALARGAAASRPKAIAITPIERKRRDILKHLAKGVDGKETHPVQ
jgi:hypothetical protein